LKSIIIAVLSATNLFTASPGFCSSVCGDVYMQDYGDTVKGINYDDYVIEDSCHHDQLAKMPASFVAIRVPEQNSGKRPLQVVGLADRTELEQGDVQTTDNNHVVGTILFDFDSSHIRSEEKIHLEGLSDKIKTSGDPVTVIGYTCSIGPVAYNKKLSIRRAKQVASLLRKRGIRVVKVEGEGDCCPVSSNKRLNRRVEINEKGRGKN
jgi:OmpA-OmpF porin, OOP family